MVVAISSPSVAASGYLKTLQCTGKSRKWFQLRAHELIASAAAMPAYGRHVGGFAQGGLMLERALAAAAKARRGRLVAMPIDRVDG